MQTTLNTTRKPTPRNIAPLPRKRVVTARKLVASTPYWQVVANIGAEIPDEEWAKVPEDGSLALRRKKC